jgi:hypothetical protein
VQIKDDVSNYKICVVDSDSDDFTTYEKIKIEFPSVELFFIKNKNYEYGSWNYIKNIYTDYDVYFCIQDSMIIEKYVELNLLNDETVYTFHHLSGYNSHLEIKPNGIDLLKNNELDFESIINTDFNLAQHSSFIVNNYIMKNIFSTLTIPPIDKQGSCAYERNFGLYFILKDIHTVNLNEYIIKHHGGRI